MPVIVPSRGGDGGKQCRPEFERRVARLAVIDRRVVAQSGPVERCGDAAGAQIGLGRRAGDRAAGMKQAARGFGRSAVRRRQARMRRRASPDAAARGKSAPRP